MSINIDFGFYSINHDGEEVCGDKVETKRAAGRFIGVLADGMGSGVKANILSTMGATILSTMLMGGESVESAVEMVVRTLPVCSERGMNYCTFSVITIDDYGEAKFTEFDNPPVWIIRNRQIVQPERIGRTVGDKVIWESKLMLVEGDIMVVTSDGALNAGQSNQFSFNWTWENVAAWLSERAHNYPSALRIAVDLVEAVDDLYGGQPTDDVTAMVVRIPYDQTVNLMFGPPEYPEDDEFMVHEFMASDGSRIICGGTTSNIVARVMGTPMETMSETAADGIPPISFMDGVDLVTEGVLTVTRAGDIMEHFFSSGYNVANFEELDAQNGAAFLAKQLLENCTSLKVFIGRAKNPAYEGKAVPLDLDMKLKAIDRICNLLQTHGRHVERYYY